LRELSALTDEIGAPSTAVTSRHQARPDRRSVRTRQALRDALARQIEETGDLSQVTVTRVTGTAGVTRRTFYSHFRDISDLVNSIEEDTLADITVLVHALAQTDLDRLQEAIRNFEPCPGAVDILTYFLQRKSYLPALLGDGGDPGFVEKIKRVVFNTVKDRASEGLHVPLPPQIFEYYLTFAISAEVGVLLRWLSSGMRESPHDMACVMTILMFVRPGDLYGKKIDFSIPGTHDASPSTKEME